MKAQMARTLPPDISMIAVWLLGGDMVTMAAIALAGEADTDAASPFI